MPYAAENLTVQQFAERLNLSVHTIRAWVAQRKVSYVRLGRAIRIPHSEVGRLIKQGTVRVGGESRPTPAGST